MTVYDRVAQEDVAARIGDAQIVLTNKALITAEVMNACPRMEYVGVTATGYNVVDVAEAKRRGIVVTNAPAYSTQAVAQHTFALLLESLSRVGAYSEQVRGGAWQASRDFCFFAEPMEEIAGKTIGLIGFGYIGQSVALGEEPPAHGSPLLGMKNAILTPHVAWAPLQTRQRLLNIVVGNVAAFVKGAPTNVVNG